MIVKNIAHIRSSTGEIQSLEEHLFNCAEIAERNASKIGLCDVGRFLGMMHDIGKATSRFNDYISHTSGAKRGEIDHSTAGAQYIFRQNECSSDSDTSICKIANQIMELVIASHHSGLIDCVTCTGENRFKKRMLKPDDETGLNESLKRIGDEIRKETESLSQSATKSLIDFIKSTIDVSNGKEGNTFKLGLLARYLLSCLIDADHTDTGNYESGMIAERKVVDWDALISRYYEYMNGFDGTTDISKIRTKVLRECISAAHRKKGIFTLSVPTGGGKTLSSLGFSLEHLKQHGMDRIIYVIPFTSIIEQNADVVRKILDEGEDIVREYHSNIDVGNTDDDQNDGRRYYSDPWDSPIIFTTMVQFLETFFSSGTKRARRMHNLANSVIIFDEIQTLPIKTVYMFNEAVNFLVDQCGSSAVLCTATQPLLGSVKKHPIRITADSEIISDVDELFFSMKRTNVEYLNEKQSWGAEDIVDLALKKIKDISSLLIIVNTKKMARDIYTNISGHLIKDVALYHLSTNMCSAHRKEVLNKIFDRLNNGKIICVSTQLIEAGIDIDFNSVIRSLAGVDSIAQAAGRCNRNGSMKQPGRVYVVKTDENLGKLEDISEGRRCAESVFREYPDSLLESASIKSYFEQYFYKRKDAMDYKTDNPDRPMFEMLSTNRASVKLYETISHNKYDAALGQSFKEANDMFHVIDSMNGIIVPFNKESREIISELCSADCNDEYASLLRRAQKYSVNTYNFDLLLKKGMIKEVSESSGIYYLLNGNYDSEYGLMEGSKLDSMIM